MKLKDLLVAGLLLLPVIAVAIISFNFPERAADKRDDARRNSVNSLSKALEIYQAQKGTFPSPADCSPVSWITDCLRNTEIIDYVPENLPYSVGGTTCKGENGYCYQSSETGDDIVVYSALESLASREYCSGTNAYILYSFVNKRTDILCADIPQVGTQRFAR